MAEGVEHMVSLIAYDTLGNNTVKNWSFFIDVTAPEAPLVDSLPEYTRLAIISVTGTTEPQADLDVTTGTWQDGRIGVYRGVLKGSDKPLVKVWGTEGVAKTTGGYTYEPLVAVIAEFFQTGKTPIDPAETIEIFEFMTAAQLSKERGGAAVPLQELRTAATAAPGR